MGATLRTLIVVGLFLLGPLITLVISQIPSEWEDRLLRGPRSVLKRSARKGAPAPQPAPKPAEKPAAKPAPKATAAAKPTPLPQQKPVRSARRKKRSTRAPAAAEREKLERRLAAVLDRSAIVAQDARVRRVTSRFSAALDADVARNARAALTELRASSEPPSAQLMERGSDLELVFKNIEGFVEQRRDPAQLAKLIDADAIAIACYQPVLDFASAKRLGFTAKQPVTRLGRFDERTAASFIRTGLALVHLPDRYFDRVACWPAVAHELGHHFLASSDAVDAGLRSQLGLPSEPAGLQRLSLTRAGDAFVLEELPRVLGGWFEEIFSDVFGSLMLGPAYATTMMQLFATPHDPASITRVKAIPRTPVYEHHPPRHLRFAVAARVIELAGMNRDASRLRAEWTRLHGGEPKVFQVQTATRFVDLPIEPVFALVFDLVDRLYHEPLRALSGYRLPEVPGIHLGLRENAAAARVRSDLRNGRVPLTSHPREIVAGAVLAVRDEPTREAELMELARRGIRGISGILDDAPETDARAVADADAASVDELREAFLLHTILSPPLALERLGRAPRDHFLGRPKRRS